MRTNSMDESSNLHPTHRRLFSSLIQVIENQLFDIENYLRRPDYPYVLNKWVSDLSKEEVLVVREGIQRCHLKLRPFAREFNLHEQSHDVRNALETKVSFLWETLENGKSARIAGSGNLDTGDQRKLDTFLVDMINDINGIMKTLEKDHQ